MVVVFVRMSPCGSVVPGDSYVGLRERRWEQGNGRSLIPCPTSGGLLLACGP
jgi:hypothetical protein